MTRIPRLAPLLVAAAVGVAGFASMARAAQFDVTVYNLSNQVLSPPIVVTHSSAVSVFQPGEAASDELAAVAEDADAEALIALLGTVGGVRDVGVGDDVIPPGGSMTVRVDAGGNRRVFTILGMLVTTNDSFYAATEEVRNTASFYGPAWDAGSEANTWNCAHIPGPPCGNPGVRVTDGAEGAIKISEGINRGALRSLDWRNPVVKVLVERVANN